MAKRKRRKPRTAREAQKVKVQTVEGGYNQGFDRTERVVASDTVTNMFRRRQLTYRQHQAADYFRRAFEYCPSIASAMDHSKVGGSAPGSRSPTNGAIWAASVLNETAKILGEIDGRVMKMIAGEGFSIDETASLLNRGGKRTLIIEQRVIGRRFRDGLDRMAIEWLGPERVTTIKAFVPAAARPTENHGSFEPDPKQRAHVYRDNKLGKVMVK